MLAPDVRKAHLEAIDERGYTILENAIEPERVAAIAEGLDRLERELGIAAGKNPFEGFKTVRIYNLLAHGEVFEEIPVHENVLPLAEGVLDPGLLVSSLSSIAIGADEVPQPLHADDQLIPLPKPHVPLVCNTIWAITDFREENGATRLVPGSHKADRSPHPSKPQETIPAEMPAGSVLVYHGSLWHGGGANRTGERRVGIAMNYCAGWVRQQENQQLGIPREIARGFAPRLRELVGYGVYNHLIGHVDKRSPVALLDEDADVRMVWDL
ncbi:MAG: phytanoyl-CoA dioxygenase [Myxococcales bacterium]|nr:phytanoyl-CoA dioxygenase [Myxococcales bacterium]